MILNEYIYLSKISFPIFDPLLHHSITPLRHRSKLLNSLIVLDDDQTLKVQVR